MTCTVRLHYRNGLFEFSQTRHMKPHERGASVGENTGLAFLPNGHPRLRPAMAYQGQGPQKEGPQHAPNSQDNERHQYQYSFAARW